jgi:hypothetical protein
MIFLAFLKRYWLEALVMLGIAATGYYVYGEIKEWQAFTKKAGEDAAQVVALNAVIAERDQTIADKDARLAAAAKMLADSEERAKKDAALVAKRDAELAAAQAALNIQKRKYRDALNQLEGADLACALRTVPPAVDFLLFPWGGQAPAAGGEGGARDAAGGAAVEAGPARVPGRAPVGRTADARG